MTFDATFEKAKLLLDIAHRSSLIASSVQEPLEGSRFSLQNLWTKLRNEDSATLFI